MIPSSSMIVRLPGSVPVASTGPRPRRQMWRVLLRLLTALPLALTLSCLTPSSAAQQFTFRHYGQDEGLRNLDVFSLIEDNDGALVMSTENGIFRYDGAGFEQIGTPQGLKEQLTYALYKDPYGRIWIQTHSHLYRLVGSTAVAVSMGNAPQRFSPGRTIAALDEDHMLVIAEGNAYLLTRTGKQPQDWRAEPYFNAEQLSRHPELKHLHTVILTKNGDLWLGCDQSICRIANTRVSHARDKIEIFATEQGVPLQPWRVFLEDRNGNLWARSDRSIRVLNAGHKSFQERDIPNGLTPYNASGLLALAEDRDGNILTQTDHGIAIWEKNAWRSFDVTGNGIAAKDISTILFDRNGHLWLSTRGHGIYRWLGYGSIENWTTAQGLGDDVAWPVFRDSRKRLWISDQLHVGLMDEKTHRVSQPALFDRQPFPHPVGFAESRDGSLWFLRINGEVERTDPEVQRITFRTQLPSLMRSMMDSSGRLWIASRNGIFVVRHPEAATPKVEAITSPPLAGDSFADIAETPDHDILFLADDHLYKLSHSDGSYSIIEMNPADTVGQLRNFAVAPDGTVWIGGGIPALLHVRIEGNKARILERVAPPQLVSNVVQIVRFDTQGRLWIGTDLGVNVYDGKGWRLISQRDGLASNDTDEGAFFAEKDGSVWISVNGGAVHVLHPEQFFAPSPLDVRVTSAKLGGNPLSLTSNTVSRWQDGSLDTTFTSSNLARDTSLRFRYRLTGLESQWNETTAHSLHYPAVPPGDYRFEIEAVDPDLHWQSKPVSFTFTIRPPWWHTQPFYFMLCVLTFVASILLWHWRERRLIRHQRMLRHLVAQRTRELEAEKAELVAAREALRKQATRDALTSLWNRSAIIEILNREMERAHRTGTTLAVVLADIDHFKQINDTLGHLAGDAVLREAAGRMLQNIRPYDYIGRYGGEEFLIVMPGLPQADPHTRVGQLQQAIAERIFLFEGNEIRVTSSFGAAWLDPTITGIEDLIRHADEALYQAKAGGRDRVVFYGEGHLEDRLRNQLTS